MKPLLNVVLRLPEKCLLGELFHHKIMDISDKGLSFQKSRHWIIKKGNISYNLVSEIKINIRMNKIQSQTAKVRKSVKLTFLELILWNLTPKMSIIAKRILLKTKNKTSKLLMLKELKEILRKNWVHFVKIWKIQRKRMIAKMTRMNRIKKLIIWLGQRDGKKLKKKWTKKALAKKAIQFLGDHLGKFL